VWPDLAIDPKSKRRKEGEDEEHEEQTHAQVAKSSTRVALIQREF
jgi:hypothetical protein